ncbi:MAG: hypothetical protein ICV70_05155 [Jiangellaceae bacterium]|nr:hypothetical protein [Jiangellaceae bacterium]
MRALGIGTLAALPGGATVVLAAVVVPADARLWIWVAAAGVLAAVHRGLRWASTVAVVGVLVAVTLRAGVAGLPLPVAAGLGGLLLAYLLALDLAELAERASGSWRVLVSGWAAAVAVPVAAGLSACALAVVAAAAPLPPSLPLALAGSVALVALSVLALRPRRNTDQ